MEISKEQNNMGNHFYGSAISEHYEKKIKDFVARDWVVVGIFIAIAIGVIASVVYGLLLWLWCGVMFPDMVETYVEQRIAVMPKAESSAEAKVAVELVKNYGAGDWAFIGAFRNGVMSIIMVFVAALIFRNENAPVRKKENKNDNEENASKD